MDILAEVQSSVDTIMDLGAKISAFTSPGKKLAAEHSGSLRLDDVQSEVRRSVQRVETLMEKMATTLQLPTPGDVSEPRVAVIAAADAPAPPSRPLHKAGARPAPAARTAKVPTRSAVLLVTLAECTQQGSRQDWHADVQFGPRCRQRTSTTDTARSDDLKKHVVFQVYPRDVVDTVVFEFVNNDDEGRGSQAGTPIGRGELDLEGADMQRKWKLDEQMDIVDAENHTVGSCHLVVCWAPPGMGDALSSRHLSPAKMPREASERQQLAPEMPSPVQQPHPSQPIDPLVGEMGLSAFEMFEVEMYACPLFELLAPCYTTHRMLTNTSMRQGGRTNRVCARQRRESR
eukprot:SAG25_NODE_24_length_22161_cov_23.692405_19_plen_345_part_00